MFVLFGIWFTLMSLLFVIPSVAWCTEGITPQQASATASSVVSPIQHTHCPGRLIIHIAVSPNASVCVIHYFSASSCLLGCLSVCKSLSFQSLGSCLLPSWFFGLFARGFSPQEFLLFSSLLVFSSVSSFPSRFCVRAGLSPTGVFAIQFIVGALISFELS